jgi:hypothetical protein
MGPLLTVLTAVPRPDNIELTWEVMVFLGWDLTGDRLVHVCIQVLVGQTVKSLPRISPIYRHSHGLSARKQDRVDTVQGSRSNKVRYPGLPTPELMLTVEIPITAPNLELNNQLIRIMQLFRMTPVSRSLTAGTIPAFSEGAVSTRAKWLPKL